MILILRRQSLNTSSRDKEFMNWAIHDFVVDVRLVHQAALIFFIDGDKARVIKTRYSKPTPCNQWIPSFMVFEIMAMNSSGPLCLYYKQPVKDMAHHVDAAISQLKYVSDHLQDKPWMHEKISDD